MTGTDLLDNAAIAKLLAREAEQSSHQLYQAFRRAARKSFLVGTRNLRFADGGEALGLP